MDMDVLILIGIIVLIYTIFALTKSPIEGPGEFFARLGELAFTGIMWCIAIAIVIPMCIELFNYEVDSNNDYYENYDNTPSEWGPGVDSNSNPGYHSVDGYYRSDATYVDSYIRSNPDGDTSNNLNP